MKILILIPTFFIISCATLKKAKEAPNIIVFDSNFAPIEINDQKFPGESCYLISENNEKVSPKGPCFSNSNWEKLKTIDQEIINSYLQASARKKTPLAKKWKEIKKTQEAKEAKRVLKLETHGSRSLYLIEKYSQLKSSPLLVRNLTATVGGVQASKKECGLNKWTQAEISNFKNNGLQVHQERLSEIISNNPAVRVINISLGYKKSWIEEDNPKCSKKQVDVEYQILADSWRNLLRKHKDVFFVVSAGNEGEDFSKSKIRNNDLWGLLAGNSNLILVGSVDASGKKASFSNFGLKTMYWGLGRDIPISYPHPKNKKGYPSMVHGTSSSAAIISGKILKALMDGVDIKDLRSSVSEKLLLTKAIQSKSKK